MRHDGHRFDCRRIGRPASAVIAAVLLTGAAVATAQPLAIGVEAGPDAVRPGERLSVTVVVSNPSASVRTNVSVRMTLPTDLTNFGTNEITPPAICTPPPTCGNGDVVTWSLGDLAPGEGRVLNFAPRVSLTAVGTSLAFVAEALVGGASDATSDVRSVRIQLDPNFEVRLSERNDPVAAGDSLVYTVDFANRAVTGLAAGSQLTLALDPDTTFESASGDPTFDDGVVTWTLPLLDAGDGGSFEVRVTVASSLAAGELIVSTVTFGTTEVDRARADSVARVRGTPSPLAVSVVATPDPVRPDETLHVAIVVSNRGNTEILDSSIQLRFPDDLDAVDEPLVSGAQIGALATCTPSATGCSVGDLVTWPIGALQPGEGRVVRMPVSVANLTRPGTLIDFDVWVEGSGAALEVAEASASALVQLDPRLELRLSERPDPVAAGGSLTYTVDFANRGAGTLGSGSVVALALDPDTTFESASGDPVVDDGVVTWTLPALLAGQGGSFAVTVAVEPAIAAGEQLAVLATFGTSESERARAIAITRVRNAPSPLALSIVATPDPVRPDETLHVEIAVSNRGNTEILETALQLRFPDDLDSVDEPFLSGATPAALATCTPSTANCSVGDLVTWSIGTLQPGEGRVVRVPVVVGGDVPPGSLIHFDAWANAASAALEVSETSASALVQTDPGLEVRLSESADPIASGGTLTYSVDFANRGIATLAAGTTLRLELDPDSTFRSASGAFVRTGRLVSWTLPQLGAGRGGSFEVVVDVPVALPPGRLLRADAYWGSTSFGVSRSAVTTRTRTGANPLVLSARATRDPARPAETVQVEISASNASDTALLDTGVRLRLPDDLEDVLAATITGDTPTGAATCTSGSTCESRDIVHWNLGTLDPGQGRVLRLPAKIATTRGGTILDFDAWATGAGAVLQQAEASATTQVQIAPTLALSLAASADPVEPEEWLTYTVLVGQRIGKSNGSVLVRLRLPEGVAFAMPSHGGAVNGRDVSWSFSPFAVGEWKKRTVTARVGPLVPDGAILEADASVTDATSVDRTARASASTRVLAAAPLRVVARIFESVIEPGGSARLQYSVENRSDTDQLDVVLEAVLPAGITSFTVPGGASCPGGNCDAGEVIRWTTAILPAHTTSTFNAFTNIATNASAPALGDFVPLRAIARSQTDESSGNGGTLVPEPSGLLLAMAAVASLAGMRRTR